MASTNNDRIVVLIDMDCFFCQVEARLQPAYAEKPLAVVQYNQWRLGGIIAVNYEAREYGVTRHMRGEEAKEKCPNLILASVPCLRGKADTSRYRSAGREVIDVMRKYCSLIERASVDEAYLDITDIVDRRLETNFISPEYLITQLSNTFVVGYSEVGKNNEEERSKGTKAWISNIFENFEDTQAQKLAVGGLIVEELRANILKETGFECSAGIAQNKILAKLACGLHKPHRQTILPATSVPVLYSTLPIKKVRNLGGKFGDVIIESLNCNVMGDLLQYSLQYLQKRFDDKTGLWLYNIARGVDNEPVTMRLVSKSIGACKKFPGKQAITSSEVLKHWVGELSAEVCERLEQDLEENERRATLLTICYHYYQHKTTVSQSRSCTLNSYKPENMASRCVEIISKSTQCPIVYLGISAGKFVQAKGSENFRNFFKSSKLERDQKTNVQTKNKKMECIRALSYTAETNALETNAIINITSINTEMKCVSNIPLKDDAQNSRINKQFSDQVLNTETDWSPTSRKLNILLTSLNERNERKTCSKKISNNNFHVNDSLDQNELKQSFFMNIFNSKEIKSNGACTYQVPLIEFDENKNADECNNLNEHITKTDRIEDAEEVHVNLENSHEESYFNELDSNTKQYNYKKSMRNEIEQEQPCLSVKKNKNDETITLENTVKLQEIFPDLNNIDPSVVALLPVDLQEEAKLYMKAQNRKNDTKETTARSSKGKCKSKTNVSKGKKNNGIYSFLVKKSVSNFTEVSSKQCSQCHEMIPVSRYNEHCDFHMAENLQRELNNPDLQTINSKRKVDVCDVLTTSVKRRSVEDILESDKNYRTTTSFLS